ncbi:MAG TPA: hypothetical protein VK961_19120 [Chthoniobacter sp.]|nr:hypothetical protein [Chthoniobacter sp.]
MRRALLPFPVSHLLSAICHPPFRSTLLALLGAASILHPSSVLWAQNEDQPPAPPAQHTGMRITFLPPPMEGTLSLGVYDKKGKLVRTLAREATEKDKEFTIGLNGLITFWDGKDDAGKPMPPGLYYARGYSVGGIDIDGIALHGNDWINDDDAPRPARVVDLRPAADDKVQVLLRTLDDKEVAQTLSFDTQPQEKPAGNESVTIRDGKVQLSSRGETRDIPLTASETAVDAALGAPDRLWVIVTAPEGTEVRAYTFAGEFLRRLAYAPGEPLPRRILAARGRSANRWSEQILLLEQNDKVQRVRSLALPQKPASGDTPAWETVIEKSIWLGNSFEAIRDSLKRPSGKPFVTDKEFIVRLIDNPLLKDEPTTAHVCIGFNDQGSYLQTTDGLPLRRFTETPGLKWVVIGREGSGRQLTIFQSDGVVVEEFKAHKLANMMAFDAGEYEWKGEGK